MSRGHGKLQRAIIDALTDSSLARNYGLTVAEIAAEVTYGRTHPRAPATAERNVRRAVSALAADGVLVLGNRYEYPRPNGRVPAAYRPAKHLRKKRATTPCHGCGRKFAFPSGAEPVCRACAWRRLLESAAERRRLAEVSDDPQVNKLLRLALDDGATEQEAATALRQARRRSGRTPESTDTSESAPADKSIEPRNT